MATISASQPISTITPPSSSHGSGPMGPWDFAVPIDNENTGYIHDEKSYMPGSDRPIKSAYHLRGGQPMTHQTNATAEMSDPPKAPFNPENEYLNPARGHQLGRKKSDISRDSSDQDSSDAHKSGPVKRKAPHGNDKGTKRKAPSGVVDGKKPPEDDERNWIHRDKLAVIESKELEEAGFIGRVSRSASRAAGPVPANGPQTTQEAADNRSNGDPFPKIEVRKQRAIPAGEEAEDYEADGATEWNLRTSEEIEPGRDRSYFVQPLSARPHGSRLPLPKHSPAPVPLTIVDRDSPLTRSRNSSSVHSTAVIRELRPRSRSQGSQVLLDDDAPRTPTFQKFNADSANDRTPPKARMPTKANPTSANRKSVQAGRAVSQSKARNPSQTSRDSLQKRPGTSSGSQRPSTSHRPEGDAPWIASMFKPDPRLPPDQQILPTHAKRLAQEKWEKEGKIGTVYDRDGRLLNTEEITKPEEKPPQRRSSEVKTTVPPDWPANNDPPLASPRSMASRPSNNSSRPGTGGTEHGGYRTMPTISPNIQPTSPTAAESNSAPMPAPVSAPVPAPATIRVQEPLEQPEKKGCGACCIVM